MVVKKVRIRDELFSECDMNDGSGGMGRSSSPLALVLLN